MSGGCASDSVVCLGPSDEHSPERLVLSVTQVYALADAVGLRYRALILLAAFTSLRWPELAALRPGDIDLDACTVRVTRQLYYHQAGRSFGPPKSRAGVRVVDFPELIVPDVRKHLDWLPSATALVFASSTGSPLAPLELPPPRMASCAGGCRPGGNSPSRPAAHRERAHRQCGRESQGTHGPDGTRQRARRADLPALDDSTAASPG